MFLGSIENTVTCKKLHPLFKQVFDYLANNGLSTFTAGKIEPENEQFFISLSETEGKAKEAAVLEAHRKYIDIQIILEGEESMGWLPVEECTLPKGEYDTDKDIIFFDDKPRSYITVHSGEYIVFFPEDGHAPCIGHGIIKKAVVKVPVDI